MPTNGLSLLPEEMRNREEEVKRKAKEAMKAPKFSMHMPEKGENGEPQQTPTTKEDWVRFGENSNEPSARKGVFKITKKEKPSFVPAPKPLPEPLPQLQPKPEPPKQKIDLWAKYCIPTKGLFKKLKPDDYIKFNIKNKILIIKKSYIIELK